MKGGNPQWLQEGKQSIFSSFKTKKSDVKKHIVVSSTKKEKRFKKVLPDKQRKTNHLLKIYVKNIPVKVMKNTKASNLEAPGTSKTQI